MNIIRRIKIAVLLLFYCGMSDGATSATIDAVTLPNTEVRYLSARANGVDYKLYVGLPTNYRNSLTSYAVLYVLDADYAFPLAHTIINHLADREDVTPLIVVGIAYAGTPNYRLHRTRDYTPYFVRDGGYGPSYQAVSGGAEKFKQFLQEELLPFVSKHYRVNNTRYLSGHSFGGLFATWLMLSATDRFNGYIIVSPSLWYAEKRVFSLLDADAQSSPHRTAKMFLAVGQQEVNAQHDMVADSRQLFERMKDRSDVTLLIADGENHNSVYPRALSDGILFLCGQARHNR